ncbi:hypothetical protein [Absidia glauca]|uniref:Uncharacterized protein n=1 Tax=Absidia glauca TaxID=4829 RepID=A0A163IYX7_ABSGL|nr:hypothetical protein [Absidia glauca]
MAQGLTFDMDSVALARHGISGRLESWWFGTFKKTKTIGLHKNALTYPLVMIFVMHESLGVTQDRRKLTLYDKSYSKLSFFSRPGYSTVVYCGSYWNRGRFLSCGEDDVGFDLLSFSLRTHRLV